MVDLVPPLSDEGWATVAPYLTLLPGDAGQREHPLRKVFNILRSLVRYGVAWRAMPNDLPPRHAVYDQAQRWLRVGCFELLLHDLRAVLRLAQGRREEPFGRHPGQPHSALNTDRVESFSTRANLLRPSTAGLPLTGSVSKR